MACVPCAHAAILHGAAETKGCCGGQRRPKLVNLLPPPFPRPCGNRREPRGHQRSSLFLTTTRPVLPLLQRARLPSLAPSWPLRDRFKPDFQHLRLPLDSLLLKWDEDIVRQVLPGDETKPRNTCVLRFKHTLKNIPRFMMMMLMTMVIKGFFPSGQAGSHGPPHD